jgi:hypothetical protein
LLGGLVVALLWGQGGVWPRLDGGIASSLGTAGLTLLVLFVVYGLKTSPIVGGVVKMQIAFAAWLGCSLPLGKALFASFTVVTVILFVFLVIYFLVKYTRRPVKFRYGWTALLNVVTILALDWLGLV